MEMHQAERKWVEMQFPVPWGHIAAKAWGSDRGQRALLVHGTLDNAGSFDRLIQYLPEEYYFIAIDLPGHGFSSHYVSGVPLDFVQYVQTIDLVLEALKWKVCVYIGHSLGANLGLFYNYIYPEKFESIICLDVNGIFNFKDDMLRSHFRKLFNFLKTKPEAKPPRLFTREEILYSLQYRRISCLTLEAAKAIFPRAVVQVGDKYKYTRDPRMNNRLMPLMSPTLYANIVCMSSCPVLILASRYPMDPSTPNDLLIVAELMSIKKNISIIHINGNHDVHNNYPERVAPYICNYLRNNNVPNSKL